MCFESVSLCLVQIIRTIRTPRATRVNPSAVVMTCASITQVPEDVTIQRSERQHLTLFIERWWWTHALSVGRWRIFTWLRSLCRRLWMDRPQTAGFPSSPGRSLTARYIRVFLNNTTSVSSACSRSSSDPENTSVSVLNLVVMMSWNLHRDFFIVWGFFCNPMKIVTLQYTLWIINKLIVSLIL